MGKYKSEDNDPYLLQQNLLGIRTYEELEEAEALAFLLRAVELERHAYPFSFSMDGFQDLHRHLFQDIYPFAGTFRDVQLMKGSTRFCQVQFLDRNAKDLFRKVQVEPNWTSLEEAINRMAFFKAELNMLHPFREGNGRTIRIFIHAYARSKGWEWKYETIQRDVYMKAMIQSVTSTDLLKQLFQDSLVLMC